MSVAVLNNKYVRFRENVSLITTEDFANSFEILEYHWDVVPVEPKENEIANSMRVRCLRQRHGHFIKIEEQKFYPGIEDANKHLSVGQKFELNFVGDADDFAVPAVFSVDFYLPIVIYNKAVPTDIKFLTGFIGFSPKDFIGKIIMNDAVLPTPLALFPRDTLYFQEATFEACFAPEEFMINPGTY